MVSPGSQSPAAINAGERDDARLAAMESLVRLAEKELHGALVQQTAPALGMYVPSSPAERAAFNLAVDAICREAHRLDLRAEELVIAVKRAWSQLASVRATRLAERDGDILREVVSRSIELFFEARDVGVGHAQT